MSADLPVPVVVDDDTGEWSVDGLPMILLPRLFWVQIMQDVEARLGLADAAKLYFDSTYKSAYFWCEKEADTHGFTGEMVFAHYLTRMSQRGWGKLSVEGLNAVSGNAQLRIDHSAIAQAYGPETGRNVCHMFNGAFCGGMEYIAANAGRPLKLVSRETRCTANGADHCQFEVAPGN